MNITLGRIVVLVLAISLATVSGYVISDLLEMKAERDAAALLIERYGNLPEVGVQYTVDSEFVNPDLDFVLGRHIVGVEFFQVENVGKSLRELSSLRKLRFVRLRDAYVSDGELLDAISFTSISEVEFMRAHVEPRQIMEVAHCPQVKLIRLTERDLSRADADRLSCLRSDLVVVYGGKVLRSTP